MTEDKTSTSADHLKASVKEALGKLTGDTRIETEGRQQKREASAAEATGAKARAANSAEAKAPRAKSVGPDRD